MNRLDGKIMEVLDWHARWPFSRIAKAARSSKGVVAYRVKRLEHEGIVVRYFPVLDMQKLGYHTSRLYFDIEELGEGQEQDFIAFLDKEVSAGLIFRMDYPYR